MLSNLKEKINYKNMLKFKLFDNKGTKNKNGIEILNLGQNTIIFNGDIRIKEIVVVTQEFEMRPQMIASIVYGTDEKTDVLLKYNGISNPFTIEAGQIYFVQN